MNYYSARATAYFELNYIGTHPRKIENVINRKILKAFKFGFEVSISERRVRFELKLRALFVFILGMADRYFTEY